jgi:DNA (cytosine-5)-methyltransferase 1
MEFGATYPFEDTTPFALGAKELRRYLGSHGRSVEGDTDEAVFECLPSYARTKEQHFPSWKVQFIRQNRDLYQEHKDWIEKWKPRVLPFAPSFQKFEWNCKGEVRDLRRFVLQIRASGVRVKRPTTSPSLVAMSSTQVPIITWENRYMTPRECARLQSMDELRYLPETLTAAYRALGNAVNVRVVELVAQAVLNSPSVSAAD